MLDPSCPTPPLPGRRLLKHGGLGKCPPLSPELRARREREGGEQGWQERGEQGVQRKRALGNIQVSLALYANEETEAQGHIASQEQNQDWIQASSPPPLHLAAPRASPSPRALKPWAQSRCAGWERLTLDHTPHDEAHGEADQGHKHPEGHQEVPILAHTEQLLLQPLQATWSRGVGSQPGKAPSAEACAGSGQEGQGQRGAGAGGSTQGAWRGL